MKSYKVRDIIDTLISHNESVKLWIDPNKTFKECIWTGMAFDIPEEYLDKAFVRIFGTIPNSIVESDTINILIEDTLEVVAFGTFTYAGTRARNLNKRYYGDKFANALLKAVQRPIPIFTDPSDPDIPIGYVHKVDYDIGYDIVTCHFEINNFSIKNCLTLEQFKRTVCVCPALRGTTELLPRENIDDLETYVILEEPTLEYFYLSSEPCAFIFQWEQLETNDKE